ncbi:alpha-ribazole phosphatase [Clostridium sp. LBM24168]
MNLYFVRHGETDANKRGLYYGKTESSLNKNGKKQAEMLSKILKDTVFDHIYISEKRRSLETAKMIVKEDSKKFIIDNRINEMNLGEFEGKDYRCIKKLYPEQWRNWCRDWKNVVPPGGESYLQFYARVRNFMEYILNNESENVLVVTHAGVIKSMYCYVLNNTIDFFWKFASHNGDISIIKYEYENLYIDSIICLDSLNDII